VTAVLAAELTNPTAAAEATGIPRQTITRWRDDPAMVEYVQKTRDQLAEEMGALAALAVATIQADVRAGKFEPRDLVTLMGVATEKSLLLSGAATSRTESRDITGTLADADIAAAIREAVALTTPGGTAPATEGETAG
jgi:hypothetical protein